MATKILYVEDEDMVRDATMRILESHDYDVVATHSGTEALRLLKEGLEADLLLTDLIMPSMSGTELARKAGLPVLYVSGYTESEIVHHGVLDEGIEFLAKPLTSDGLLKRVREVLATPATGISTT